MMCKTNEVNNIFNGAERKISLNIIGRAFIC